MNIAALSNLSVPAAQRGMALVMALVILLILTILGITAMTTSSLEEKMSGNTQEQTRALQTAESGVSQAIVQLSSASGGTTIPATNYPSLDNGRSTPRVMVTSNGQVTGGASVRTSDTAAMHGATGGSWWHYDVKSRGTTITNARTLVNQGVKFPGPGDSP